MRWSRVRRDSSAAFGRPPDGQLLKSAPITLGSGEGAADKAVTFSGGLASADERNDFDGQDLLVRADAALYTAKRSGRDRVVVSSAADALSGPSSKI